MMERTFNSVFGLMSKIGERQWSGLVNSSFGRGYWVRNTVVMNVQLLVEVY